MRLNGGQVRIAYDQVIGHKKVTYEIANVIPGHAGNGEQDHAPDESQTASPLKQSQQEIVPK